MSGACRSGKSGSYPDEDAADRALAEILSTGGLDRLRAPCRTYRCPCGQWHLTSKPAAKGRRR